MWTQQAVETLRKFALEGRSAAWIAAALGAPSRNAVIGKASRIGIRLNGGTGSALIGEGLRSDPPPPPQIPWRRRIGAHRGTAALGTAAAGGNPLGKGGLPRANPRSGHSP